MTTDKTDAGLALASPEGVLRAVLEREYGGGQALNATLVLDALTAAGYAVVALPEPDHVGAHTAWINERQGLAEVHLPRRGLIDVDTDGAYVTPDQARALAAALLAAANHQEKNQ